MGIDAFELYEGDLKKRRLRDIAIKYIKIATFSCILSMLDEESDVRTTTCNSTYYRRRRRHRRDIHRDVCNVA